MEVCISCPQACIIFLFFEIKGKSFISFIGRASISPLNRIVFLLVFPFRFAITPYPFTFVIISTGSLFSFSITFSEVLFSLPLNSG